MTEEIEENKIELQNSSGNVGVGNQPNFTDVETSATVVMKKNKSKFKKNNSLIRFFPTLTQISSFSFLILILWFTFRGELVLFSWHPVLLSLGWLMSMTQAILILNKDEMISKKIVYPMRIRYHWILQSAAAILVCVGFIIVVVNKNNQHKEHFKTWHGLLGLLAFIFSGVTLFCGVLALYNIIPKITKLLHIFLGIVTYVFGGITLILSTYTKWFDKKSEQNTFLFLCGLFFVSVSVIGTLVKPVINLISRIYRSYFLK